MKMGRETLQAKPSEKRDDPLTGWFHCAGRDKLVWDETAGAALDQQCGTDGS